MVRFHFAFAADFAAKLPELGNFTPAHGLRDCAENFVRNILRIQSLGRFPAILVGAAVLTQTYDMLARAQLMGLHDGDIRLMRGHPAFDQKLWLEKEALRKRLQAEWFARSQAGEVTGGMTVGEVNLATFVASGGDETSEAIDAVLIGMVTGLWTSVEVLIEQTWNAVVAERPLLDSVLYF